MDSLIFFLYKLRITYKSDKGCSINNGRWFSKLRKAPVSAKYSWKRVFFRICMEH